MPDDRSPGAHDWAAETTVPDGDEPLACRYCGRPFPTADLLALHHGGAHPGELSPAEREAALAAADEEAAALRKHRLLAVGGLVLLYFGFLFAFSVFG